MEEPTTEQQTPHCYVHTDRETYITCARCGRPICPDCMVAAPVGFQCPACVRQAEEGSRTPLTPMGGSLVKRATVTQVLIGINVAVFLLGLLFDSALLAADYGMQPATIALQGEWWRLLTAAFLHAGLLHIAFNMYVLCSLGPTLESLFGHVRFLILYLVSALGGSIASYAFSPPNILGVGASGAVFGLMAALLVVGKKHERDVTQVLVLLAINLVIGFLAPGIDWRAHIGGALTGAAVAAAMAYAPQQSRVLWQTLGVLAILGILVLIMMWRTVQFQGLVSSGHDHAGVSAVSANPDSRSLPPPPGPPRS